MPMPQGKVLNNFPTRPLNKGMRLDMPPNGMEAGSFLRIQNYRVNPYGLQRRDGFMTFDNNTDSDVDAIYNERLFDMIHFYKRQSNADLLMLGERSVYRRDSPNHITNLNMKSQDIEITSNTAAILGQPSTVVIYCTNDQYLKIKATDNIIINGVKGVIVDVQVFTVDHVTIGVDFGVAVTEDEMIGTSYVVHNLYSHNNMTPTYAMLPIESAASNDTIVIADQADRGLYKYDSASVDELEPYVIDSSGGSATTPNETNIQSGRVVRYFEDRLWIANTVEMDGEHRQRIRWSEPLNFTRFRFENYVDLPYTEGQCINLVPLGSLLIAYFEDAIYFGRATNISGLPFLFTRMETGNAGLVSTKAVVPWLDSHYFVGQDDIYILSGTSALQAISASINPEALDYTRSVNIDMMKYVQCEHDPITDTIAFMFPDNPDDGVEVKGLSQRIWRYNYRAGAFSYDEVPFLDEAKTQPAYLFTGLMPTRVYLYGKTWEDWQDLDPVGEGVESDLIQWIRDVDPSVEGSEAFSDYNTWYDLIDEVRRPKTLKLPVWSTNDQRIIIVEEEETMSSDDLDGISYPVWALIESPDSDFNAPDTTKTFTRLSIKSFRNRSDRLLGDVTPLNFTMYISGDMGFTFKRPAPLRFRANYNEGKADFRVTGSTFRFKLVNGEDVPAFKISEYVVRGVGRGLQIQD